MARPTKEGLEYFPLDTDIDQDEKVIMVIAKYGMRGFGVVIRLMMEVYKNGYHYPWTEREKHIFSLKVNEPVEIISEIVDECLAWEFFHQGMFNLYGILTSKGFQKRFLLATNRRKGTDIAPAFNLIRDESNTDEGDGHQPIQQSFLPLPDSQKKSSGNVYAEILGYLNEKTGKRYSAKSDANKKIINGRLAEGRTLDDFKYVIDVKCNHWLDDEKMCEYLRPSTLFAQKNFDNYLNQKPKDEQKRDRAITFRDKEAEFQQYMMDGGDPDAFDWS